MYIDDYIKFRSQTYKEKNTVAIKNRTDEKGLVGTNYQLIFYYILQDCQNIMRIISDGLYT